MGPATVSTKNMRVSSLILPASGDWNRDLIQEVLPGYEKEILMLKPSKLGAKDKWVWLPTKSGEYTSRSGYYEGQKETEFDEVPNPTIQGFKWKDDIWSIKSTPKTKMLLWKAMQNALPVGENLKYRNVNLTAQCPHCGENETVTHLFFSCTLATRVWEQIPCKTLLNLSEITTFRSGFEATKALICLPPTGIGAGPIAPWLFWSLWHARNQKIFNQSQIQPEEIILLAVLRAKEWQDAQTNTKPSLPPQIQAPAAPLSPDILICWIFTKSGQSIHHGADLELNVRSPLLAEASAILFAVRHAIELGFRQIHFASDSSNLIKALNSEILSKELHGIHHDILTLSLQFDVIAFNFISRASNVAADVLAKKTLRLYSPVS
ncbi:unnamed protein product [Arabidopsis halleri]